MCSLVILADKSRISSLPSFFGQIGEVAKPIILDWVIAQHERILEWTGRAFDLEVGSMWT